MIAALLHEKEKMNNDNEGVEFINSAPNEDQILHDTIHGKMMTTGVNEVNMDYNKDDCKGTRQGKQFVNIFFQNNKRLIPT